jgi:NitT/TauT family transport system substrate-binding protein
MGSLNVIFATHPGLIDEKPEIVAAMMQVHKDASKFCMTQPEETATAAVEIFGMTPEAVANSLPNVELNWELSPELIKRAAIYAIHMRDLGQIREIPNFSDMMDASFSAELATSA